MNQLRRVSHIFSLYVLLVPLVTEDMTEMWVATDNLKPPNRIPAGIDKGGGHLPLPAGNVVKCCCALVVTSNRSADEVFMQLTTDNLWVI